MIINIVINIIGLEYIKDAEKSKCFACGKNSDVCSVFLISEKDREDIQGIFKDRVYISSDNPVIFPKNNQKFAQVEFGTCKDHDRALIFLIEKIKMNCRMKLYFGKINACKYLISNLMVQNSMSSAKIYSTKNHHKNSLKS